MIDCLCVGAGGFIGSVCRYLIGQIPMKTESGFPYKTLAINVVGAFIISLIAAGAAKTHTLDSRLVLMLKVGLCGGFTTFSTFAFETNTLLQKGAWGPALLYIVLSVVLSVAAVILAQLLVR